MGVFDIFSRNKAAVEHRVFRYKKNGKKYLIVADGFEEAEQIINTVYPGYGALKEELTEELNDKELIKFYGNEKKNIYETNY